MTQKNILVSESLLYWNTSTFDQTLEAEGEIIRLNPYYTGIHLHHYYRSDRMAGYVVLILIILEYIYIIELLKDMPIKEVS